MSIQAVSSSATEQLYPTNQKPMLNFWQIWNMCFGFLGIQFGFALQNANVSRIFQTLGADIEAIPLLWIAAPVTGLLVQPIVGYLSDRTWTRLGRRRPFFLLGAILSSIALVIMPNSPTLWIAAGMLWVLDASINISMEPFRALVGDMLPKKQQTKGFSLQSFFIGTGAIIASVLPWFLASVMGVENTAPEGQIPPSVKLSFYFGAAVLFSAVVWTIIRTKEYNPEQLADFNGKSTQTLQQVTLEKISNTPFPFIRICSAMALGGIILLSIDAFNLDKQLYIFAVALVIYALLYGVYSFLKISGKTQNSFFDITHSLMNVPATMRSLAVVQFFSWFALFSMWIYATPAVTQFHFGAQSTTSLEFNNGADWVGVLFAAYNGFAALAALAIPKIAALIGRRKCHLVCLTLGGVGLISFVLITEPRALLFSMLGVGFAWASILSIPYALLAPKLPANKMGVFMGIFNFFIVIPQIIAAATLGLIVEHIFSGNAVYALVLGGSLMILAGILTLRVKT